MSSGCRDTGLGAGLPGAFVLKGGAWLWGAEGGALVTEEEGEAELDVLMRERTGPVASELEVGGLGAERSLD